MEKGNSSIWYLDRIIEGKNPSIEERTKENTVGTILHCTGSLLRAGSSF
jgi:hypothetical protein